MIGISGRITRFISLLASILAHADARAQTSAPPLGQWQSHFDKRLGHVVARYQDPRGVRLSLSCDSAGQKPGRGVIAISFPQPDPGEMPQRDVSVSIQSAGQIVRFTATLGVDVAKPVARGRSQQSGGGAAAPSVTAQFTLDGSPERAAVMSSIAGIFGSNKTAALIRIDSIAQDITVVSPKQPQLLSAFTEGCQNYFPATDDEVIWDWHQGLDTVAYNRSITLVAQAVSASGELDNPRLSLHCHAGHVRVTVQGLGGHAGGMAGLAVTDSRDQVHLLDTRPGQTRDEIEIAENAVGPLLTLLGTHDILRAAIANTPDREASFPVAGFHLATRLARQHCPSISR